MSRLVRLYPAAWRERYGEEMEALLEERPLGPFDVVDLLLGALDAHLHLRGLGHASEHEKGITMSLRTAGIGAIVAGAFWALTWAIVILDQLIGEAEGNVPVAFLTIMAAGVGTLVSLAGLSAVHARVHRRATWISFLAPASGIILVLVGFLGMAAIELFWAIGMFGLLLFMAGSALFAVVTYLARVFARPASALIGAGAALSIVGWTGMLSSGGHSVSQVISLAGVLVFALGWILIGIDAIRRDKSRLATGPAAA